MILVHFTEVGTSTPSSHVYTANELVKVKHPNSGTGKGREELVVQNSEDASPGQIKELQTAFSKASSVGLLNNLKTHVVFGEAQEIADKLNFKLMDGFGALYESITNKIYMPTEKPSNFKTPTGYIPLHEMMHAFDVSRGRLSQGDIWDNISSLEHTKLHSKAGTYNTHETFAEAGAMYIYSPKTRLALQKYTPRMYAYMSELLK